MSQSGPAYEARRRKSTANAQTHREPETTTDPKPACRDAARDGCEWRTPPYSDNLAGIHPLCERCFRSGDVPATGEPVVMSRNHPSVLHRLHNDTSDQPKPVENRPAYRYRDIVEEADEPVDALDALREGDGVVWRTPQIPLEVITVGGGADDVHLRGPGGGEYVLRRAETVDGAYVIYPGYGLISGLSRIRSVNDRPEKGLKRSE